jgi:hypothetical protein
MDSPARSSSLALHQHSNFWACTAGWLHLCSNNTGPWAYPLFFRPRCPRRRNPTSRVLILEVGYSSLDSLPTGAGPCGTTKTGYSDVGHPVGGISLDGDGSAIKSVENAFDLHRGTKFSRSRQKTSTSYRAVRPAVAYNVPDKTPMLIPVIPQPPCPPSEKTATSVSRSIKRPLSFRKRNSKQASMRTCLNGLQYQF